MNTLRGPVRRVGAGQRTGRARLQPVQPRRLQLGGRVPIYQQYDAGQPRLQDRVQQLRAERRRRVAAQRAERLAARAPRRSRPGDRARQLRRRLQQRRPQLLHGMSTTPIPAARCRRRVGARARSSRSCPPGETLAGAAAASTGRLGPSPDIPTAPVYPMAINFTNGVNLLDPGFRTPLARSYSVGLQRALSRADGRRSPLRRHAAGRRHDDRELELRRITAEQSMHRQGLHEQRLPRRVPAGAAEPAGRHRPGLRSAGPTRRARSPIRGPAPAPARCRSIWRTSTARRAAQAGDAARYTGRQLDEHARGSRSSPRATRTPGRGERALRQRDVPRQPRGGRPAAQLLRAQPGRATTPSSPPTARTTRYDSLQINLRRLPVRRA